MPHFPRFALFLMLIVAALVPAPLWAKQSGGGMTYRDAFAALDEGNSAIAQAVMARGNDPVLNKVLKGYLMAQPGNDYSFDELASFISDHPDWHGLKGIRMIAEQKLPEGASAAQIVNWFNANPPLTHTGFARYIEALDATGHGATATGLIKARWIEKDFSATDQSDFIARYAPVLVAADHVARLDRLLWDNNITAARAMFAYVSQEQQAVAEARIALANQTSNAENLVAQIPSSFQRDAGLLYERLRWRRKNDNDDGAIEILLNAPKQISHADKWWDESSILIRRLIERKDYKMAYRLADEHRLTEGFDYVQAEFIAGWLALRFLNKPSLAHKHFSAILDQASSPISRSRGFYWLGRTYEAAGQKHDARESFQSAAAMDTTFYGQLALARLHPNPTIRAASEPAIPQAVRARFMNKDSVQAIASLTKIGETTRARAFLRAVSEYAAQRVEFALLLELAYQLQRPDWAVAVAKAANQKNFVLTGGAYPILAMDLPTPPDRALTHALIRQESQFKADAGSPAGARGLMQLMPGTAKDVAKKLGLPYSPERLIDPDYNVKLGTYFIQKQIDNFDGSYVLALAGYNAGPRRAREWIDAFGDPRDPQVDVIDWIELIPIYETRNYVQRIIENLQFYRSRLAKGEAPLLILQDLKR